MRSIVLLLEFLRSLLHIMDNVFSNKDSFTKEDLISGGIFLVDKPLKWTSFDVVNKIRYQIRKSLQVKKFKVGHTGTLDPLATGLLVICFGSYTKKINDLISDSKSYEAETTLGASTPSCDLETAFDVYYPTKHITKGAIDQIIDKFTGDIEQFPPIYSAIKKDGIPLYKHARAGTDIEIPTRTVTIYDFSYTEIKMPILRMNISCSKGTYIRSIARDIGTALKSGAHLSALRRTRVGNFSIESAWNLETLVSAFEKL